jgi:hypothetical protein
MTVGGRPEPGRHAFGRIVERRPSGGGPHGITGMYFAREDQSGQVYGFDYSDIVTEGFRTVITGERVRFETDRDSQRARFVIRLDLPEVDEFYR